MEDLSERFANMLVKADDDESIQQSSIEGLAYASLQSKIKERLASNEGFLLNLVNVLNRSPPKSPVTYGCLTVLSNLTMYRPVISEEQKRMNQLKAYANASKSALPELDPLEDAEHVANRGKAVFKANTIPVLVTHSQHGSMATRKLVVTILFSLSKPKDKVLRGKIAQQGGIKLLVQMYSIFPESEIQAQRITAHALAQLLISTNPEHVFGGSNPLSPTTAIRPLVSLLSDDPTVETRDLLPIFESLLALTNLASTDDSIRNPMIRVAFPKLDELLISDHTLITRASVELVCNLMVSDQGVAKFADGTERASRRMHILLALADSPDVPTRRAAGGALATMTVFDAAVNSILERDMGVKNILQLCVEEQEDLRHRGIVIVLNLMNVSGKIGDWGVQKLKAAGAYNILNKGLTISKSEDVVELMSEALKKLAN
jgi:hypothetical protein